MVLFVTIFASLSLITSQPDTSASYDEKLQEGIEAFYNTEWEKAESLFRELMEEDATDPQPHFFSSMMPFWEYFFIEQNEELAEEFLSRSEKAVNLSEQKLDSSPNDTTMVLLLSGLHGYRSLVAAGESNYRVAIRSGMTGFSYTRKLLSLDTDRPDARIGRGMFYYMLGSVPSELKWATNLAGLKGDMEQGFEELKKAAESDSYVSNDATMLLMYLYNKEERYEEALSYAEKLTERLPKNVIFKFKKAEILENSGNKDQARELFAEIAESNHPRFSTLIEKSKEKVERLTDLTQNY
ncbi:tetratricopeptide repeat protein [Rhodohalobacter sp.]|uniref:tetratricopeptide repeat protein n=1 Tax=Rhodohalobacter sp. TaxID=1974210 RepID=UPI002ACE26E7|nr:tetratricopeptide repeat protein [Rhodohalobacter sp.]MDZ7755964.1 tetratricopeptide repeat protein [Rhodohalobacter sp.]